MALCRNRMNETQKALEQAIAGVLKPLGYTKRAATWHREREQVVSVLNLQKSQWGENWYLNLGVYLRSIGDEARPPEARCHVRCRAEMLSGRELPREPAALATFVGDVAVPWLDALDSERGVAEFLSSGRSRACFVHRSARERLGVGFDSPAA